MKYTLPALIVAATFAWSAHAASGSTRELLSDGLAQWVRFLPDANANPDDTWSVRDGVVHCTGKPSGYIRTRDTFSNYVVHVEWKWTGTPGNSGLLLHVGEPDKVWPTSMESQLMNGNAGDVYVIDTTCNEKANGRRIKKLQDSNEKAIGEWNEMEVTCQGDTITIRVNGTLQNRVTGCSVTSGHIALQSEGKPIAFRNVTLTPLKD